MTNVPRYVTSDEFTRYIQEESNFRSRLEQRLSADHETVREDLSEIKGLVRDTNGRVLEAEKTIGVLRRDVEAMKSEELDIEKTVHSIREQGCAKFTHHVALTNNGDPTDITRTINISVLSRRQKLMAGAGVALVAWPAVQEIARTIHALVMWLEGHP